MEGTPYPIFCCRHGAGGIIIQTDMVFFTFRSTCARYMYIVSVPLGLYLSHVLFPLYVTFKITRYGSAVIKVYTYLTSITKDARTKSLKDVLMSTLTYFDRIML